MFLNYYEPDDDNFYDDDDFYDNDDDDVDCYCDD